MKKSFKVTALIMTLVLTVPFAFITKPDVVMGDTIKASIWKFSQGGQYSPNEEGNEGYIESVTMNDTEEVLDGWLEGDGSTNQIKKQHYLLPDLH